MPTFVEQIVKKNFAHLAVNKDDVYQQPEIPEKKLKNAISSYAKGVLDDKVLALYDSTVFGGAKEGCLVTGSNLYIKEIAGEPVEINFSALNAATRFKKGKKIGLKLMYNGKSTELLNEGSIKYDNLFDFLQLILDSKEVSEIDDNDKLVILQDMPETVKINYVKILVNMVFEDDGIIDKKELAEIQTLITQLNFSPELRNKIRVYISVPNIQVNDLLGEMGEKIPKGSELALHISLVKDMIRVHRSTKIDQSISKRKFILTVCKKYEISDEQIEVLEVACKNDELIRDGKVDDSMIIKNATDLAAKASAVGVPIAAIYLSGSVIGLSASGIVSGLAALGLGGVLGFSSMVTGIGVIILAGVTTYKGIQWLTGGSKRKRDKNSKREFMIQEIIRINQKTICNLAEDVNFFGLKIVELIKESEIDKKMIEKIGKELVIFNSALDVLQSKGINLEELLYETE